MDHKVPRLDEKSLACSCTSSLRPQLSRAITDPTDYSSQNVPFDNGLPVTSNGDGLEQEFLKTTRSTLPIPIHTENFHEHCTENDSTMESGRCTAGSFSSSGGLDQVQDQIARGRSIEPGSAFLQLRAIPQDRYYSLNRFLAKEGSPSFLDVIENTTETLDESYGDQTEPPYPKRKRRRMSLETDLMMVGAFAEDFEE